MINAILKKGVEIKRNEDVKTSSIIGVLSLLPAELFWKLLKKSFPNHHNLPLSSGDIVGVDFWPHWYVDGSDKEVTNDKYVEPDVYIEFENFNLIIEVKLDGNPQYPEQWKNQILAYQTNVKSSKPLVYVALGGNCSYDAFSLTGGNVNELLVYRCSWQRLLETIHEEMEYLGSNPYQYDNQNLRILRMAEQAFAIYGERVTSWMESIPASLTKIDSKCLNEIRTLWRTK